VNDDRTPVDELLTLEGENRPEPGSRGGAVQISRREATERRVYLAKMLASQYDQQEIYTFMAERFKMNAAAVDRMELAIYEAWDLEDSKRSRHMKTAAVRRLHGHVRSATKAGNWAAVANFERILANMLGLNAPLEVRSQSTVTHASAAMVLMEKLTPAQRRELLEGDVDSGEGIEVTPVDDEDDGGPDPETF